MNPASSVELRKNSERFSVCYKELTDNIQERMVLGELPDFVVVDNIGGSSGSGANNVVQLIMSNKVVWHNTRLLLTLKRWREQRGNMNGKS